jgi:hypothetical protein
MKNSKANNDDDEEEALKKPFIPVRPSAPPLEEEEEPTPIATTPVIAYNQANLAYPLVEIRRVEFIDFKAKFESNLRKNYPTKFVLLCSFLTFLLNLALIIIELSLMPNWNLLKSYASNDRVNRSVSKESQCDTFLCHSISNFVLFMLKVFFLYLIDVHIYFFGFYKALIACVNIVYAFLGFMTGM